jgi:hypothetical protein
MAEGDPLQAIVDLRQHVDRMFLERDRAYERLENERDLRYQQRWEAQVKAVTDAMLAAEKAIAAALTAAEKAVLKAETAANGVSTEFRQSLANVERRLTEKIDAQKEAQDLATGSKQGSTEMRTAMLGVGGFLLLLLGFIAARMT